MLLNGKGQTVLRRAEMCFIELAQISCAPNFLGLSPGASTTRWHDSTRRPVARIPINVTQKNHITSKRCDGPCAVDGDSGHTAPHTRLARPRQSSVQRRRPTLTQRTRLSVKHGALAVAPQFSGVSRWQQVVAQRFPSVCGMSIHSRPGGLPRKADLLGTSSTRIHNVISMVSGRISIVESFATHDHLDGRGPGKAKEATWSSSFRRPCSAPPTLCSSSLPRQSIDGPHAHGRV